ncbi:GAF and ANTAR domain-containing protein [Lentzea sp. NBRC 105346]|uniref:GAF and ANTAR domain-containing protein n=1 Tax=Lentzea sp. NBRC 105346 TaxID=3032205 RepID=UPI0025533721|nr:GAF and ANTAR domain-containing protein [Lentzea sp. NBRC 105346]
MTSDVSLTQELATVFARMSGLLLSSETVNTALKLITSVAAQTFPGTVGAGITLLDDRGERITAAATDAMVDRVDRLQYRLGGGPCLTAWEDRVVVRVHDLTQDTRWPDWARHACEAGLRSSLSAPLVAGATALGAMKVYAAQPNAYAEREEHLLILFAAQAAMLLANTRTTQDAERVAEQLKDNLRGREVLAVAKGILMARNGVDERAAFLTLTDTAQRQGTTLRQTAEQIARSTVRRRR